MKIELLKPYGMAAKGDILDNVNKPIADELIRREIAKAIIPKKKKAKKCSNTR